MKRSIFITAIALIVSAGLTAQEPVQNQDQSQDQSQVRQQLRNEEGAGTMTQTQAREHNQVQTNTEEANHGQTVR